MRIRYKYGIKSMSGKLDGLVHMAFNKGRAGVGRIFVRPRETEQHILFAKWINRIALLWRSVSEGFKQNLTDYTLKRTSSYFEDQIPAYSRFANWVKALHNLSKEQSLDIETLTTEQMDEEVFGASLAEVIAKGYLPSVPEAQEYTNLLWEEGATIPGDDDNGNGNGNGNGDDNGNGNGNGEEPF